MTFSLIKHRHFSWLIGHPPDQPAYEYDDVAAPLFATLCAVRLRLMVNDSVPRSLPEAGSIRPRVLRSDAMRPRLAFRRPRPAAPCPRDMASRRRRNP